MNRYREQQNSQNVKHDHSLTQPQDKYQIDKSLASSNENSIKLFIRTKTAKSYILNIPQQIVLSKIKRAIQNLAKISEQNQMLVYKGKQISPTLETMRFENGSILHVVDKSNTAKESLNIIIKRVQDVKNNVKRSHHFPKVNLQMKISEFIEDCMGTKQQFCDFKQLFLVFLGKKLNQQKTFKQCGIQDGSEIYCVHKQLDKRVIKRSELQSFKKSVFTKRDQTQKNKSEDQKQVNTALSRLNQRLQQQQQQSKHKTKQAVIVPSKKQVETFVDDIQIKSIESDQQENAEDRIKQQKGIKNKDSLKPNFKKKIQQYKVDQELITKMPISPKIVQRVKRANTLSQSRTQFDDSVKGSKTDEDMNKIRINTNTFPRSSANGVIQQQQELEDCETYNKKHIENNLYFLNDSLEGMNIDRSSSQQNFKSQKAQYIPIPFEQLAQGQQQKKKVAFTFRDIEQKASMQYSRQIQSNIKIYQQQKEPMSRNNTQETLASSKMWSTANQFIKNDQIPLQSVIKNKNPENQQILSAKNLIPDGQTLKRKTEQNLVVYDLKNIQNGKTINFENLPSSKSIDFDQLAEVQRTSKSIKSLSEFNEVQLQEHHQRKEFQADIDMQSDVTAFKNRLIQKSLQKYIKSQQNQQKIVQLQENSKFQLKKQHQNNQKQSLKHTELIQSIQQKEQEEQTEATKLNRSKNSHHSIKKESLKKAQLIQPIQQTEQQKQIELTKLSHIKIQSSDSSDQINPFSQDSFAHSKTIQRKYREQDYNNQIYDAETIWQKQQENEVERELIMKHHVEQQLENQVKPYLKKLYSSSIVNFSNLNVQKIQEDFEQLDLQEAKKNQKQQIQQKIQPDQQVQQLTHPNLNQQAENLVQSIKQSATYKLTIAENKQQNQNQQNDNKVMHTTANQFLQKIVNNVIKYTIKIKSCKSIKQQEDQNDNPKLDYQPIDLLEQFVFFQTQSQPQRKEVVQNSSDLFDLLGISPETNKQANQKLVISQQKHQTSLLSQIDQKSNHFNQDSLMDFMPQSDQKQKKDSEVQFSTIKKNEGQKNATQIQAQDWQQKSNQFSKYFNKDQNSESEILNTQRGSSDQYSGHFPSSDENKDKYDSQDLNQNLTSGNNDLQRGQINYKSQISFNHLLNQSQKQEADPKISFSFRKNKDIQLTGADFIVPFSDEIKFPQRDDILKLYQNVNFINSNESCKSVKSNQQKYDQMEQDKSKRFSLNNKENLISLQNLNQIITEQSQNYYNDNMFGVPLSSLKGKLSINPDKNSNESDQSCEHSGQIVQQKNANKCLQQ